MHYGMKARGLAMMEKVKIFFIDYGKIFIVGVSLSIVLVSAYLIAALASPQKLRVSFLDVGQGDAILIRTPSGHDMLIDGGPTDSVLAKMGSRMNYFDRDLDVMIATHDDADHVTGLIPVLQKFAVRTTVVSPARSDTGVARDVHGRMEEETSDAHVGSRGDVINFGDGVIVRILYPHGNLPPKTDTNDASVSVLVTYGEHSFLLTGDLPSRREPQLFGSSLPHGVTVYKAGHHGSKTSSGEALLTYIRPEYAVISVGRDNRYGHPDAETIGRLEKYSKEILSTSDRGTITFASDGRMMEVEADK
jgi:competence protein ComEC